MTVGNTNYIAQVILSSATQVLPSDYYFLDELHILVLSDGRGTLVLGTDYSINLPPEEGEEGEIVMITGVIGETITHINCPPCTQLIDFVENDRFPAALQEKGLDKLTMIVCKIRGEMDSRFLQYPIDEINTSPFLPIKKDRTGAETVLFGFDPITGAPIGVSPGSLNLNLLLLTASDLGGATPSNVNGATQQAIKCYIDLADAALKAEIDAIEVALCLNANGTWDATIFAGTDFLAAAVSLCTALIALDVQIKTNKDDIVVIAACCAANAAKFAAGVVQRETDQPTPSAAPLIFAQPGTSLGTVNLVLPAGRKWTYVDIFASLDMSSSALFAFGQLVVNGGVLPAGSFETNRNQDNIWANTNSDDTRAQDVILKYIPTAPLTNQAVSPFFRGNASEVIVNRTLFGIGYHEAV